MILLIMDEEMQVVAMPAYHLKPIIVVVSLFM